MWLKGDGHGGFKAMSAEQSGVRLHGEGRGAALCDYDGDGRLDLVVAQNGADTKLYHNDRARPGLRVRFNASPGNPTGIGTVMRMKRDAQLGPAREVHAGSGYWSQDSAVQVVGMFEQPGQLLIRWPGGQMTTNDVPSTAREVTVDAGGKLKVVR